MDFTCVETNYVVINFVGHLILVIFFYKSLNILHSVQGQFVDSYDPTIENTFSKMLKYKGQEYEVLVVDTAGDCQLNFLDQCTTLLDSCTPK